MHRPSRRILRVSGAGATPLATSSELSTLQGPQEPSWQRAGGLPGVGAGNADVLYGRRRRTREAYVLGDRVGHWPDPHPVSRGGPPARPERKVTQRTPAQSALAAQARLDRHDAVEGARR